MNRYPTEVELKYIREYDFTNGIEPLLEFLKDIWAYPDRIVIKGKKVKWMYLSTGGWSGNEDIIGALMDNYVFWIMCWRKSTRGGHYWFKIRLVKNLHRERQ